MGMSGMKRHLGGPFSRRVRLLVFGFAGASYRNARIQEYTLSFKSQATFSRMCMDTSIILKILILFSECMGNFGFIFRGRVIF